MLTNANATEWPQKRLRFITERVSRGAASKVHPGGCVYFGTTSNAIQINMLAQIGRFERGPKQGDMKISPGFRA